MSDMLMVLGGPCKRVICNPRACNPQAENHWCRKRTLGQREDHHCKFESPVGHKALLLARAGNVGHGGHREVVSPNSYRQTG